MEKTVRVALIGFGGMGRNYAKMLCAGMVPGMKLTGVCCRNAEGQALLREEYPGVAIYRSVEDMEARSEEFDAAMIVTPHTSHVSMGLRMAKLKKHVLMDKPAGICAGEVEQLINECHTQGVAFAMIFNNRLLPAYRKAHEMLQSGALGQLHRAVWVCNSWYRSPAYHRSAPWRSSWNGECGGMLMNQNPHNLDLWQWLFGAPQRVWADIGFGRYNDFLVDDAADIQLSYDNGFHGTIISATGEAPGVNRLEIWGTKGRLTVEDNARVYFDENQVPIPEFGAANQEKFASIPHAQRQIPLDEAGNPYLQIFENFSRHLLHGDALCADGHDGLRTVQLTNAIYVSAWEDRRVTLPVDEQRFLAGLAARQQEELQRK